MYAQKIEGDQWVGERMDPAKIDKMSGEIPKLKFSCHVVADDSEQINS